MTLEELKALPNLIDWDDQYFAYISHRNRALILLQPEILALVEAANKMRGQVNEVTDEIVWLEEAIEAFNAKLESL